MSQNNCSPPWSDAELRHKVTDVANRPPLKPRGWLLGAAAEFIPPPAGEKILPAKPKAIYNPDYLAEFTSQLPDGVDAEYLEIRSQFTCWNRSPAGFLHKIFRKGESIWVTTKSSSRDGLFWTHDGPVQNLAELNDLASGCFGVWFLSNPIDGTPHQADRLVSDLATGSHSGFLRVTGLDAARITWPESPR